MSSEWWGKRLKTHGKTTATRLVHLSKAFSQKAGRAVSVSSLVLGGASFVPGLGTAAGIAASLVGLIGWLNSETWSNVENQVQQKLNRGQYHFTVDINAWNMEVKVY